MTPGELRETVARAMWMACDWGPMLKPYEEVREADKRVIRMEADAAIAIIVEEMARVAEQMLGSYTTMDNIPAAIRAYATASAPKPQSGG